MAGQTKTLSFSEGVSVTETDQSFTPTTKMNSYSSDSAYVAAKGSSAEDGDHYWNTTSNVARIYNGTSWGDWNAGSGAGAGAQYSQVFCAEKMDGSTNNPIAVSLSQKRAIVVDATHKWLDINEGSGEVSVSITEASYLFHDIGFDNTTEDSYNLAQVIEDALNATGGLAFTYTVTYSKTTRKISISAGSNFSILWNSGTNTANTIGLAIGFDISADDSGTSNYTADNEITGSLNTQFLKRTFISRTDSSLIIKSKNFAGFVDTSSNKLATTTVNERAEISTFDSLSPGEKYYTLSSKIIISSSNNAIDFQEDGGAELNATIASDDYFRGSDSELGHASLCLAIKTAMEAVGTGTYSVVFDKNEQKFTIAPTATVTNIKILWLTGTNTATAADNILGWDTADTTNTTSQTSDNIIPSFTGNVGIVTDSNITIDSKFTGFATRGDGTTLYGHKDYSESDYTPIIQSPNDWLALPRKVDDGQEVMLLHQNEDKATGKAMRVWLTIPSNSTFKFEYKNGHGLPWQSSLTTISQKISGTVGQTEDSRNVSLYARCAVSEKDPSRMVCAIIRIGATYSEIWAAYSNDGGNNFSLCNSGTAVLASSVNFALFDIAIRENKCVIFANNMISTGAYFFISDDSGSGFTTFGSYILLPSALQFNLPGSVVIRYDDSQTGNAKYQITMIGMTYSGSILTCVTADGIGTNITTTTPFSSNTRFPHSFAIDEEGSGNRILISGVNTTTASILDVAISNDYTGGSAIAWTSKGDVNSGGSNIDQYFWYNAATAPFGFNYCRGLRRRSILAGNFAAVFCGTNANISSKVELGLFYNKNIDASAFETKIDIGQSENNPEYSCVYLASIRAIIVIYKYLATATLANNLTNGQIFARLISIQADNDISLYDVEQIDGGESEAGFQGFLAASSSASVASISWEKYVSTHDHIWSNDFL